MHFNISVPSMPRPAALPALCALLAMAHAAPAHAATANWTPEAVVSDTAMGATNVRTGINDAGRAVMVWDQLMGSDAAHPYGIYQVHVAVRATATAPWSAPQPLSAAGEAVNAGAVAARDGSSLSVFWNEAGVAKTARSTDAGATWVTSNVPGGAGFELVAGANPQIGPAAAVDAAGNITMLLAKANATTPPTVTLEALVRDAKGAWKVPSQLTAGATLFGSAHLKVLANGRAFMNYGFTTAFRTATGVWQPAQSVNLAGLSTVYSASADMDAGGKAYFALRTRYQGAQLSTSIAGAAWSPPAAIPAFDGLGSSLYVAASSSGHAILYGNDTFTGNVQAAATANGAASWSALADFGFGDSPQAVGAENGLFALGWSSAGANWDEYAVAAGSFLGAAPWAVKSLAGGFAAGTLAIAARPKDKQAKVAAGLAHDSLAAPGTFILGAATAAVAK